MACDISYGRKIVCKTVGGIKNIYFVNYRNKLNNEYTFDAGSGTLGVETITPKIIGYKYELRGSQSMNTVGEVSRDNGTSFYTSTGTFKINGFDLALARELENASKGSPQIVAEDFNGTFKVYGWENGCDVSVTQNSGATMGDGQNNEMTITSIEKRPPHILVAPASNAMTIVEGA